MSDCEPLDERESQDERTGNLTSFLHFFYLLYAVVGVIAFELYLAPYYYANCVDPHLTGRGPVGPPMHAYRMIRVWRSYGHLLSSVISLFFFVGVVMLLCSRYWRRCWGVWCLLAGIVLTWTCPGYHLLYAGNLTEVFVLMFCIGSSEWCAANRTAVAFVVAWAMLLMWMFSPILLLK